MLSLAACVVAALCSLTKSSHPVNCDQPSWVIKNNLKKLVIRFMLPHSLSGQFTHPDRNEFRKLQGGVITEFGGMTFLFLVIDVYRIITTYQDKRRTTFFWADIFTRV